MIAVKVDQLFLSNLGFVVVLKSDEDERGVPIFIGSAEAQAIAIQLQGVTVPRPLTHDLLKIVFDYLECRLHRVEVCDIRDGTFFGRLVVEVAGQEQDLDCRPSDAIALALRAPAPIFVHEKVMEEAGRVLDMIEQDPESTPEGAEDAETGPGPARTPLEILNKKLELAIRDERYEDAARLRDEIKKIEENQDN